MVDVGRVGITSPPSFHESFPPLHRPLVLIPLARFSSNAGPVVSLDSEEFLGFLAPV